MPTPTTPLVTLSECVAIYNQLAQEHGIDSQFSLQDFSTREKPTSEATSSYWSLGALQSGIKGAWNWAFGGSTLAYKAVYRKGALASHPDKTQATTAEQDFVKLSACYEKFKNGATDEEVAAELPLFSSPWQLYAIAAALGLKNAIIPKALEAMGAPGLAQKYKQFVYSFAGAIPRSFSEVIVRPLIPKDIQYVHDAAEQAHLEYFLADNAQRNQQAMQGQKSSGLSWFQSLTTTAWGATKAIAGRAGLSYLSPKHYALLSTALALPRNYSKYQRVLRVTGSKMKAFTQAGIGLVTSQIPTAAMYGAMYLAAYVTGGDLNYGQEIGYATSLLTSYALMRLQASSAKSLAHQEKNMIKMGLLTHQSLDRLRMRANAVIEKLADKPSTPPVKEFGCFNIELIALNRAYQATIKNSPKAKAAHALCGLLEIALIKDDIKATDGPITISNQLDQIAHTIRIENLSEVEQALFEGVSQSELKDLSVSTQQAKALQVILRAMHQSDDLTTSIKAIKALKLDPIEKMMFIFKLNGIHINQHIFAPMQDALSRSSLGDRGEPIADELDVVSDEGKSPSLLSQFDAERARGSSSLQEETRGELGLDTGVGLGLSKTSSELRQRRGASFQQ